MKIKSEIGTLFFILFFIGLVAALTTGGIEIGNYFDGLVSVDINVLLDYLGAGLAFLTLGLLSLFLMIRFKGSIKEKSDKPLLDENKEDQ